MTNDLGNDAIFNGLFDTHPVIPICVFLNLLKRTTGLIRDNAIDTSLGLQDLFHLNFDIGGIASRAAGGLVHEIASIWQREAMFFLGGEINIGGGAGDPACPHNPNLRFYKFDHVINDIARFDVPPWRTDVKGDGVIAIG